MATDIPVRRVRTPAGDPAWLVDGYDDVKALLADPRLGRSHPEPERAARYSESVIFGRPLGSPETERANHASMRRLLTPAFSARRLASLRPQIEAMVDDLLDDLARQTPPADFHEAVSFPLPALVICQLLGVPYEDREDFRRWSDDAADMGDEGRSLAGMARLFEYMGELVDRKRREPADDVVSDLVAAMEGAGEANRDGVAQLAAGLLFAGHETTVAAIDRGTVLLLTNPEQREAIQRDATLVPRAVEEILRHPDPVVASDTRRNGGLPRWANEDLEIGGVTIHAGELVLLALHEANQDDHWFSRPTTFDVGREPNAHLTFGHGPRFCIGAPLARIELQALFGRLFHRFPTLRLAVPFEDLRPRSHLLTGGLAELPVAW